MYIKNSIKNKLRKLKWKYLNYFSEQGIFTRKIHHIFCRHDPLMQTSLRKSGFLSIYKKSSQFHQEIANEIKKKGYIFLDAKMLNMDDSVLEYCSELRTELECRKNEIGFLDSLEKFQYAGKTISYQLYQKKDAIDPLNSFANSNDLISIAALYLKHLPILEEISFIYNPIHNQKQFGSQLWHLDSHYKNLLKVFFSPLEIKQENGPFEFFPPSLSTLKYYSQAPQGMTDADIESNGLDVNCAIKFVAKPGTILLVDTTRCLHRGGVTKSPRFISMISFGAPFYSFAKKAFLKTGAYKNAFEGLKQENIKIIENFKS